MRTHSILALAVALLAVAVASAAPAPFAARERAAAVLQVTALGSVKPGPAAERLVREQIALLRSNAVLQSALRNPEVARLACLKGQTDPVRWLEARLAVRQLRGTQQLRVSVAGCPAAEAVALVNAVVAAGQGPAPAPGQLAQLEQMRRQRVVIRQLVAANGANNMKMQVILQELEYTQLNRPQRFQVVQPARALR
jgi:hypothetical protein